MIVADFKYSLRVILIGGSSNVGKSTIAQSMALKLGWSYLSTDSLARHPGRPWRVGQRAVPEHVVDHYRSLSVDELFTDVKWKDYFDFSWQEVFYLIKQIPVTDKYKLEWKRIKTEEIRKFLIDEHDFDPSRVNKGLERISKEGEKMSQKGLNGWVK